MDNKNAKQNEPRIVKENKSVETDNTKKNNAKENGKKVDKPVTAAAATASKPETSADAKTDNSKKSRADLKADKKPKKDKKEKKKRLVPFLKNVLILAVFFSIVGIITAVTVLNMLKANTVTITDNNFWQSQSTALVYNANGSQIGKLSERDVKWRDVCRDLKEGEEITEKNELQVCGEGRVANVSPHYVNALIATEDQGYMDHNGVNYQGLVRVGLAAAMNGDTSAGGGSSITMQLAKLLYLQPVSMYDADGERVSWKRGEETVYSYNINYEDSAKYKLSQIALALKIEEQYNKEEVMDNYININYFGVGGFGITNASKYYYDTSPYSLTIAQAATLAGMTQRPTDWDPYKNPEGTTKRRNTVINRMESEGYITAEEAEEARNSDISADLVDHSNDSKAEKRRLKYYNDVNLYVLEELEKLLGVNADINTGGMKIHTTIDSQMQTRTIDVLDTDKGLIGLSVLDGTQAGTAMIDVSTGGILAIGNGFDGDSPYAYAYNELRNPGSTAKPLTAYAPAIEYLDWSTAHNFNDKTTYYTGTNIEVQNYSRSHVGNVTMMRALASSLNTTAVQSFQAVVNEIGLDGMTSWFGQIGLYDWKVGREEENPQVYESYTLGAFGTTPIEMASAFATFANDGVYNEPHIIEYIEFDEQSPYYEIYGATWYPEYDTHQAMKPATAYLITKMLDPSVAGSITKPADVYNLDIAIKTGTTNWGPNNFGIPASAARDRWTIGYSPDVATAVWYGYEYEAERKGSYFWSLPDQPLYIFRALMSETVNPKNPKLADGKFDQPSNVVGKFVGGVMHYFIVGSEDLIIVNTPPAAPSVEVSISGTNVVLTWSAVERADSYEVLINGKKVENTDKLTATITYDQLFAVGCNSSYEVGVQAVGSNGLSSSVSSKKISNNVSNCQEEEKKEPAKKEDSKKDDDAKEDEKASDE